MFAVSSLVEKSFEIWPGRLALAARGKGARDAIDAGMDAVREVSLSLLTDAELLSNGRGNVLPRGKAARLALEAMHVFRDAISGDMLPPVLAALPGSVCDVVLAAMRNAADGAGDVEFSVVSLGDAAAIHMEPGTTAPQDMDVPAVLGEFMGALGSGVQGGAAIGGIRSGIPTCGVLDIVAAQSKSAALAGLAAAALADAALAATGSPGHMPRDKLMALGWRGRVVNAAPGFVEPELVWEALSLSVRRGTALREKKLLRAAALGLRGRGRTIGPIDGDRLLRFGVSEWR